MHSWLPLLPSNINIDVSFKRFFSGCGQAVLIQGLPWAQALGPDNIEAPQLEGEREREGRKREKKQEIIHQKQIMHILQVQIPEDWGC